VYVCFSCPSCERPARIGLRAACGWQCPACDYEQQVGAADPLLRCCAVCGNHELYRKKDFPHWLGMTILVVACLASVFTYLWYEKFLTWAILIGSAIVDGILYLSVGDAIVCYRCDAHHKGFTPAASHQPFELTIGERYRQERIRAAALRRAQEKHPHRFGPM
jgi:hypothetical protein